jgi:hypothetical protein
MILIVPLCVVAQQHTPGRVAGSPNNPQTTIPRNPANPTARTAAINALTADPGFVDAQSVYPELNAEGYRRLQFFSQQLKDKHGISQSVHNLAAGLSKVQGDPVRLLVGLGVSRKDARRLSKDSLR